MGYKINPAEFASVFLVPSAIAEKYIKLAGATQLKILLLALKDCANGIDPEKISEKLSLSIPDVLDALNYWADLGIFLKDDEALSFAKAEPEQKPHKKIIRKEIVKPSRDEISRLGNQDKNIEFLLREAQMKLSRPLKQNEASTIVWLYDSEGLETSIILMLISFAVTENKATLGFIEKTAVSWLNDGVSTVQDAEAKINEYYEHKSAWSRVSKAFGIPFRMPSKKESTLSHQWIYEYGFDDSILTLAYDKCVDATSKLSMDYIKKILDSWHKAGVKTIEDIDAIDSERAKANEAKGGIEKYDLDAFNDSLQNILPD